MLYLIPQDIQAIARRTLEEIFPAGAVAGSLAPFPNRSYVQIRVCPPRPATTLVHWGVTARAAGPIVAPPARCQDQHEENQPSEPSWCPHGTPEDGPSATRRRRTADLGKPTYGGSRTQESTGHYTTWVICVPVGNPWGSNPPARTPS
jgi:hypothetical protein